MHPEEYPPQKATCKLHLGHYTPLCARTEQLHMCPHTASPKISANADLPPTLNV